MARNIIFVAGAHGTGKGKICQYLCEHYFCEYLSVSKLLKWNKKSKLVENVDDNQEKLIHLLKINTICDFNYIVDGHFVLMDATETCHRVEDSFFYNLKPDAIILVTCQPDVIQKRLKDRDGISYSVEKIIDLQTAEAEHAMHISEEMAIPLITVDTLATTDFDLPKQQIDAIMKRYRRDNILSEMLKAVIMRLDFSGATEIGSVVNRIKQLECIQKAFGSMQTFPKSKRNINFRQGKVENEELSIDIVQDSTVYQFTQYKLQDNCTARLDFDDESMTLVIECDKNYQGSKEFTDLFVGLMSELNKIDSYITFERLGIRKIDLQILDSDEDVSDYFNEHFVVSNSWTNQPSKKTSSLTELLTIEDVNFNIVQRIDKVKVNSEDHMRLIYDIDSYIDGTTLSSIYERGLVKDYLHSKMQDTMFDLFVNVASTHYLEKSLEAKTKLNG